MKIKILWTVLLCLPLISFAQTTSPVDVKIIAWNVYMLPKPFKFSEQTIRTKLIAAELSKLDHDIILLEEAFIGKFRDTVTDALSASHPYVATLPRDNALKHVMSSGLIAFSKFPMKKIAQDYYQSCVKSDCFASKGVMILEVELPLNRKLHVASTHLNCGRSEKAMSVRAAQVQQIVNLTKNESASIPLILAGDLNIDAKKEIEFPGTLSALGMQTTKPLNPLVQSTDFTTCYKKDGNTVGKWVDHILLNPRNSNTEILNLKFREFYGNLKNSNCALSDHQAIEATIRIHE